MPIFYNNLYYPMFLPYIPTICEKPPTLYAVLNSIVNVDKNPREYTNTRNLAKEGRKIIFDFEYPLTDKISKEKFETMILNHFIERRIGFETVTSFIMHLDNKLNEIMPLFNKMFDALDNWDIFNDGEKTVRSGTDDKTSESINDTNNTLNNHSITSTNDVSDRRNSELPQDQLELLRDGSYVTNYNYDTNTNNGEDTSESSGNSHAVNNGKDKNIYQETIERSPADKISILKEMQENIKSIYTMIFKELDCLFYQLL